MKGRKNMKDFLNALKETVMKGDHKQTVQLVRAALESGISAIDILEKGLVPGVKALGDLFKDGQVYLPEVLITTRAMKHGVEELKPNLAGSEITNKGTLVLGTVEGDLHDIGKNLVGIMLSNNGFEVIDVGVNVSAGGFIDAACKHNADIIAMSALLTTTIHYFSVVIETLERAGLKDQIKVMIGGAPVTRKDAEELGAEGFAEDCARAVDEASRLIALKSGSR
jgi:5-methyltetrahydrofolate--homocysteine methyltransferase